MYLSTMALETTFRKLQSSVAATARARRVFPVPGLRLSFTKKVRDRPRKVGYKSEIYPRSIEQDTLGRLDPHSQEKFRVDQRQFNDLEDGKRVKNAFLVFR